MRQVYHFALNGHNLFLQPFHCCKLINESHTIKERKVFNHFFVEFYFATCVQCVRSTTTTTTTPTLLSGWPPNQGIQGIQGKVREFTCCLKKVKNSQGKRHKNAAKSGKKHPLEKIFLKSGNLHVVTFTSIRFKVPYIHLHRVKFSPAAA